MGVDSGVLSLQAGLIPLSAKRQPASFAVGWSVLGTARKLEPRSQVHLGGVDKQRLDPRHWLARPQLLEEGIAATPERGPLGTAYVTRHYTAGRAEYGLCVYPEDRAGKSCDQLVERDDVPRLEVLPEPVSEKPFIRERRPVRLWRARERHDRPRGLRAIWGVLGIYHDQG